MRATVQAHHGNEGNAPMHRRSDFDRDPYAGRSDGFNRAGSRILDFLRSRSADHWVMFLAGVVVGMIVG